MLKLELIRCNPQGKGLLQKKHEQLVIALRSDEFNITNLSDINFIVSQESDLRSVFLEKQRETEDESARRNESAQITTGERMLFLEAVLSDEVKGLYKKSQDCLTAKELDARNSVLKMVDFYDQVLEVFNNDTVLPETKAVPDLHEDFQNSYILPLKEWKCTRDKAKDLLVTIRPKI